MPEYRRGFLSILLLGFVLGALSTFAYIRIRQQIRRTHLTQIASPSPQTSPSTASNVLIVKELGIKLTLPDDIKDLTYVYKKTNNLETVLFTTKSLIDAESKTSDASRLVRGGIYCTAENGPLGAIDKLMQVPSPGAWASGGKWLKVGNFYVVYESPQATCSNDKQVQNLETQQTEQLKKAFQTVELSQ